MLKKLVVKTPISQKFRSPALGVTSGSQILLLTPKSEIPKLGVNFFIPSAPGENTALQLDFVGALEPFLLLRKATHMVY